MSRDSGRQASAVSRRKYLLTSAAIGTAGLAGCSDSDSGGTGSDSGGDEGSNSIESGSSGPSTVTAEGSSTVYPISNRGSSYWNSNSPASDGEYWGSNDESSVAGWDQIETDQNIADYFASLYGFETTGERSNPPFATRVALSHSGTGCEAVRDGLVDIGNSSGPITAELDISEEQRDENYVDHVVGRDGQPVFVSQAIYDAGVEQLTGEQIRGIYQGDITNWSEVGGPDREIFVVGRAEGSGTDTSFRLNMLGDADAPMDVDSRFGQNQQVQQVLQDNDNAIGYMALAFSGSGIQAIGIEFEGTLFEPDADAENTIFDSEYPLNRDLHMYTRINEDTPEGTDMREAAFLNMFLTEFGQQTFVEDVNYITLPTSDIEAEREKLPDQA
ncbi:substrate-binding domain-containing protein [Halorubrum lacusprofundi]|jgi:phosphate transport system substrate-binding protein|uniref:ABC-type phosphate transport system, substrate binding protein n=1 Tax=Halorubrum lacusprofundi (strain ATCC 49239 / DSM 5036 / JCM 8891 / ACAM 34) TaxID=416348 RepID=B9LX67_HALLT|nr:substrate-binding domain-containing protein [Halorubrum lacusprofundi]ACM59058.1 ABC-type phosphate transport system, substrate binding protein [Halorubrum lacusprofundi ATCC 49239]MCG1007866.1 substrate-binding domain-containing protein [Halorubrum lacusprofundi]